MNQSPSQGTSRCDWTSEQGFKIARSRFASEKKRKQYNIRSFLIVLICIRNCYFKSSWFHDASDWSCNSSWKIIWFYQLSWQCKLATVKRFENHGGQFTLSTQLIKPNYLVILPATQHHSFFRNLPPLSIMEDREISRLNPESARCVLKSWVSRPNRESWKVFHLFTFISTYWALQYGRTCVTTKNLDRHESSMAQWLESLTVIPGRSRVRLQ